MKNEGFIYWRRPRHKWFVLAAGALQLLCLWMNVQEYGEISAAGVLSASQWADFAAQKNFQCAVNGLLAACFFGVFAVGMLAGSRRAARRLEGALLLLLAAAWGAAGAMLGLFSSGAGGCSAS